MIKVETGANLFEEFQLEHAGAPQEPTATDPAAPAANENPFSIETLSSTAAEDLAKELAGETAEEKEGEETEETPETSETTEETTEETSTEEEEDGEITGYSYKGFAEHLIEQGIVSEIEDLEELENTPEILETVVRKEIEGGITSYKESLPPVVSELVEFIENGGDPSTFLQALEKPVDLKSLDLSEEANQELVVRKHLELQDYSPEEIEELITDYKDGLILEKQAGLAAKKLDKAYEKQREQLLENQKAEAAEQQRRVQEYIDSVKSTVDKATALGNLEIPVKEKPAFLDYMLKVNPKTGMTRYQEELQADFVKNSLDLAYLKFKNFDFSRIEKKAKDTVVKDLKSKLFTKSESTPKGKTREAAQSASLEGFKSMFGRA